MLEGIVCMLKLGISCHVTQLQNFFHVAFSKPKMSSKSMIVDLLFKGKKSIAILPRAINIF